MTEVEAKVTLSKKSRKNKAPTPIYRSSSIVGKSEPTEELRASPNSTGGAPDSKPEVSIALRPPEALLGSNAVMSTGGVTAQSGGGVAPPTGGPIKSYSDFMRSLAAKYNNNE